eukprot:INCI15017.8.p1 GENE.INCI15017.8~~INCI15017.8.p1  ORF type:complete len:1146 (-),score=228.07 INCI15017.8:55-3492(-)
MSPVSLQRVTKKKKKLGWGLGLSPRLRVKRKADDADLASAVTSTTEAPRPDISPSRAEARHKKPRESTIDGADMSLPKGEEALTIDSPVLNTEPSPGRKPPRLGMADVLASKATAEKRLGHNDADKDDDDNDETQRGSATGHGSREFSTAPSSAGSDGVSPSSSDISPAGLLGTPSKALGRKQLSSKTSGKLQGSALNRPAKRGRPRSRSMTKGSNSNSPTNSQQGTPHPLRRARLPRVWRLPRGATHPDQNFFNKGGLDAALRNELDEGGPPLAERLAILCNVPLEKAWQRDLRKCLVQALESVDSQLDVVCDEIEEAARVYHALGRKEHLLQLQYCQARLDEVLPAIFPLHQLEKAVETLSAANRAKFNTIYDENEAVAFRADANARSMIVATPSPQGENIVAADEHAQVAHDTADSTKQSANEALNANELALPARDTRTRDSICRLLACTRHKFKANRTHIMLFLQREKQALDEEIAAKADEFVRRRREWQLARHRASGDATQDAARRKKMRAGTASEAEGQLAPDNDTTVNSAIVKGGVETSTPTNPEVGSPTAAASTESNSTSASANSENGAPHRQQGERTSPRFEGHKPKDHGLGLNLPANVEAAQRHALQQAEQQRQMDQEKQRMKFLRTLAVVPSMMMTSRQRQVAYSYRSVHRRLTTDGLPMRCADLHPALPCESAPANRARLAGDVAPPSGDDIDGANIKIEMAPPRNAVVAGAGGLHVCNCPLAIDEARLVSKPWSDMEKLIFVHMFLKYPKDFRKVAEFLENRTARECVAFYYDTKFQIPYKLLLEEQQSRRKETRNAWAIANKTLDLILARPSVHSTINLPEGYGLDPADFSSSDGEEDGDDDAGSGGAGLKKEAVEYDDGSALGRYADPPTTDGLRDETFRSHSLLYSTHRSLNGVQRRPRLISRRRHRKQQKAAQRRREKLARGENPSTSGEDDDDDDDDNPNPISAELRKRRRQSAAAARARARKANAKGRPGKKVTKKSAAKIAKKRKKNVTKGTPKKPRGRPASGTAKSRSSKAKSQGSKDRDVSKDNQKPVLSGKSGSSESEVAGAATEHRRALQKWTDAEKRTYVSRFASLGKNWEKLAIEIPSKTVAQIKNFYQNYKSRYGLDKVAARLAAAKSDVAGPESGPQ